MPIPSLHTTRPSRTTQIDAPGARSTRRVSVMNRRTSSMARSLLAGLA